MDRKLTAALFLMGKKKTAYSEKLKLLAESMSLQIFSSAPNLHEGELHYLRFPPLHGQKAFDLIFYDVADTAEHAACFYYLMKWPGIIFLDSIELPLFSRAVSHSAFDGWGFRWILGAALAGKADLVARLSDKEFDIAKIAQAYPLACALVLRSAAAVANSYQEAGKLTAKRESPPVAIIEKNLEVDKFFRKIDKSLPLWLQRMKEAPETISPVQHPHLDLLEVEKRRVMGKYSGDEQKEALEALEEMFASQGQIEKDSNHEF